ncbi:hypothetical protein CISIN_1g030718mg [Citrus sinensis]|uniref:S1-like domain-containing protein n=1 Tax=Citrus sinensis TaxID=2711 RepID=A0A067FWG7_CITSI|nr:hypothetical protein CISIN_1g030718mg [Citrus sinensis]
MPDMLENDIKLVFNCAGSFVVVDESGKEKAIKDGSKVACIVTKVLFYEQVRALQKSTEWPEIFKSTNSDDANGSLERQACNHEENDQSESDDDDGLPPLEANINRMKPMELQTESESDSESDTDS